MTPNAQGIAVIAAASFAAGVLGTFVGGQIASHGVAGQLRVAMESAAAMAELYELSQARVISGPGGLGRIMILPEDATGPLRPVPCPPALDVPAVCLSLARR